MIKLKKIEILCMSKYIKIKYIKSLSKKYTMDQDAPFNFSNKLINHKQLKKIVKDYINIDLYRQAFTHKSYILKKNENIYLSNNSYCPSNCCLLQESSNERLEFLGDSILSSSVADYLYERYPDQNEGFMTKIRSRLVNGDMLSFLAKKLKISEYILISKQLELQLGRTNNKILEDTLEAFIAAIYLDLGFEYSKKWIINIMETYIDFSQIISKEDYKDQYIKIFQNKFGYSPIYAVQNKTNTKNIIVHIIDENSNVLAIGVGKTKKIAEEKASAKALGY